MNILLYSPSMEGHPQVYCRVLTDILLEEGHQVVIAGTGTTEDWFQEYGSLRPLLGRSRVWFENTKKRSRQNAAELTAEELKMLQEDMRIDSTLFVEGDYFSDQFRRIAEGEAPRLKGWNAAIFSLTSKWYPGEDAYSGEKLTGIGGTLRQTIGHIKRTVFNRKQSENYFYETLLIRRRVVDSLIVKDERILERYGSRVHWMPEIYRVFEEDAGEQKGNDWEMFADPVRQYIESAGAENVLLYFGTGTWYKGYDFFLKLAEMDSTTYALHAGAPELKKPKPMAFNTSQLRKILREQGRLFETNAYVESSKLVNFLFNSIERFVSTHRLTLSSGTMLQALETGKPVLVPATGLVGRRVQQFGLGKTYQYLDEEDLVRAWREFRREPVDIYRPKIQMFMQRFSREAVRSFFLEQLCS